MKVWRSVIQSKCFRQIRQFDILSNVNNRIKVDNKEGIILESASEFYHRFTVARLEDLEDLLVLL